MPRGPKGLPVVDRKKNRFDPPQNCITPYEAGTKALAIIGKIFAEAERLVPKES